MIDPQFYLPESMVGHLDSYAKLLAFRQSISQLHKIPDGQIAGLQAAIHQLAEELKGVHSGNHVIGVDGGQSACAARWLAVRR